MAYRKSAEVGQVESLTSNDLPNMISTTLCFDEDMMDGRTHDLAMSIPCVWIERGKMAARAAARQQWLDKKKTLFAVSLMLVLFSTIPFLDGIRRGHLVIFV